MNKGVENLKPFKKGQSGNPKGRPKKFVSHVLDELAWAGYSSVTKSQVVEIYESLLALPEKELKKLAKDPEHPMIFRIIVKAMLSKRGFDIVERMIDRAHGRPKGEVEIDLPEEVKRVIQFIGSDGKRTKRKTGRNTVS